MNDNSKSKQLLDKVYEHLDSIDVTKLSMSELEDFLGVVQRGQFLESFGQTSAGFGGFGCALQGYKPADHGSGKDGDGK